MKNKFLEAILIIAGIALLLYFFYEIRQVIVYIILSAIVALIGQPLVRVLNKIKIGKFHLSNTFSAVLAIIMFLSVISFIALALIPLINEQAKSLSLLNINELEKNFSKGLNYLDTWLNHYGIDKLNLIENINVKELIDFSFIPNFLNSIMGTLGGLSIGILTITFISFFFLKDKDLIQKVVSSLVPDSKVANFNSLLSAIKESLSRYLFGLIIQITILFILYTIILYIAGIKNFVIIAFLGALLNLIPYVGPLIGFVLMNVLSVTGNITADVQSVIIPMITKISIGYIIVQLIDNFFNQPVIFSKTAHAHPLEIFLVIIIAGNLFGIVGMIIAIPAYTILRIILKEFFSEFKTVQSLTKDL